MTEKGYSQRRACRLVGIDPRVHRYRRLLCGRSCHFVPISKCLELVRLETGRFREPAAKADINRFSHLEQLLSADSEKIDP
jgi:hypothetical protein